MKSLKLKLVSASFFFLAAGSSATSMTTTYADVRLTHIKPQKGQANWVRADDVSPKYPLELAKKGIAGCGIFRLTVNEEGRAEDIELVNSIPEKAIYKPGKKIIRKWHWLNTTNEPVKAEQKLVRLDFCMGGDSLEEAQARCEQQAKLQCSA